MEPAMNHSVHEEILSNGNNCLLHHFFYFPSHVFDITFEGCKHWDSWFWFMWCGAKEDSVVENEGDIVPNLEVRATWPVLREL